MLKVIFKGISVIIDDKIKEIVQITDKFDGNGAPDAGIADSYKPKGGE
ncbi:hypothetical protein RC101_002690 [Listeria monocytogenes]|nr:hypothetical protein [Listeria monocytogenes]ELP1218711.1 hypothetical protein [Listeria monocytogenes]